MRREGLAGICIFNNDGWSADSKIGKNTINLRFGRRKGFCRFSYACVLHYISYFVKIVSLNGTFYEK